MKHFYKISILFLSLIALQSTNLKAQIKQTQIVSQTKAQITTSVTSKAKSKISNNAKVLSIQDSVKTVQTKAQKVVSNTTQIQSFKTVSQIKEQLTTNITNKVNTQITDKIKTIPLQDSINAIIDSAKVVQTKVAKAINPIKKTYTVIANNLQSPPNLNSLLNSQIDEVVPNLGVSKFKKIWDRTTYSLDLALGSTNTSSLIRLVPAMGVRVTKFYTIGIGLPLQHANFDKEVNRKSFEDFMYGVKVYHRLNLPKGLYFQLDNDFLNTKFSESQVREWMPAMWTGFGYNLKVAKNFGISTMVMYNALHKEQYTPYNLPLDIRVGFNWYQPTKPIFGNAKKLQQEIK